MKTAELTGVALIWSIAKAEGEDEDVTAVMVDGDPQVRLTGDLSKYKGGNPSVGKQFINYNLLRLLRLHNPNSLCFCHHLPPLTHGDKWRAAKLEY